MICQTYQIKFIIVDFLTRPSNSLLKFAFRKFDLAAFQPAQQAQQQQPITVCVPFGIE